VPLALSYAVLRRFHDTGAAVLVPTQSIADDLRQRGFQRIAHWTRGVDTDLFRPLPGGFADFPRPILLYAGRIAPEKNIPAFLSADVPGMKVVVGDGPEYEDLKRDYSAAHFTGRLNA
jgi:glycosyltransferase involved in cell wall biosynthesis